MARYVVVLWLVACQGTPGGGAVQRPAATSEVDPLRPARDYERGHGVVRDYARAAEMYRQRCDGGAGDVAACRRLLDAIIAARGVDRDVQAALTLALAMCERDDLFGCLLEGESTHASEALGAKLERLLAEPCDAQHRARCEVARDPYSGFSQSGTVEYENHQYDLAGCRLGVIEACARLRYATDDAHAEAVKVLTPVCARGDAEACEALDRPLPARERCAAHDYAACLALGCAGDGDAAAAALAHHAGTCAGIRSDATVATDIHPSPRPPLDSLEFRPVGAPATGYTVHNVGTRPVSVVIGEMYGYDDAGSQTVREHFELRDGLAPGAGTLLALRERAARFEPCVSVITFDDAEQHLGRCPSRKPPHVRWGNGRDNVVLTMSFPDVALTGAYGLDDLLAVPFEQAHPGVYVNTTSDAMFDLASESTEPYWIAQWEATRGPLLALPLVLEATAIVYRLENLPGLRFSAPTLAGIFSGAITRWNDRAIARDNPGRALPDLAIQVLQPHAPNDEVRVTRYLTRFAPRAWKLGERRIAPLFPGAQRAWTNDDGPAATLGAISYAGAGVARKQGLEVAQVQGPGGAYATPTPSAVSTGAYPIASPRILYVMQAYASAELADAARAFAGWLLDDGLAVFEQLGYARPAAAVTQAARAQLQRIDVRPARPPASEPYVAGELAIHVRVLGPGRRPSAGARVVHRSYDSSIELDRTTGRDGTLIIDHVRTAPQRYDISVRGRDGAVGAASIDVTKPGRVDVTVALRAATDPGVLHVRVLDAQRRPIAGAQVLAAGVNGVPTDARGDTAIDLHDRYTPDIQVWSTRGVSQQVVVEMPERAPTTIVVGP